MRLKAQLTLVLLVFLNVSACTHQAIRRPSAAALSVAPARTLTVMAAASLTEPFTEIGQQFETQNPNIDVCFSFASSQQLEQQLELGAPADVYASANTKYMDAAVAANRIDKGEPQIFAHNRLVIIFPKGNPGGLAHLQDLAKPGLKLDFAAKEVPVGAYTIAFLDKASRDPAFGPTFKDEALKNVVSYEDNVKAVLTKVILGEADGGIVYLSDVNLAAMDKLAKIDIPDQLNIIATYPIAVVKDSQNQDLARAFVDLVLSPDGQARLGKYNFVPVVSGTTTNSSATTGNSGRKAYR